MRTLKIYSQVILIAVLLTGITSAQDWPDLNHYQNANSLLPDPTANEARVVFMGNSITESWIKLRPEYFSQNPYVNRGISGQTSPQMLARFRADVLNLDPKITLILAGTNDIAGNTGPITLEGILGNIISMAELARFNNIEVILGSVLPAKSFSWKPKLKPADDINALNALIKTYAKNEGLVFIDFHSAMANTQGGLKKTLSDDGVHPNHAGYKIMETLAEQALERVKRRE